MKFHIISMGETLEKIAFLYGLETEEIKKENKHIRIWERLIPGTKLKIPTISEAMDVDLTNMEPFIEDYYPKLKIESMPNLVNEPASQPIKQEIEEEVVSKTLSGEKEIKNFPTTRKEESKEVPIQQPPYVPLTYQYPQQYVYYNYPRYVYPVYYYPVYYYPNNK